MENETEDFANALCNLLCEIENGAPSDAIIEARDNLERVTRASNKKEADRRRYGFILKAVIEQFDIFIANSLAYIG